MSDEDDCSLQAGSALFGEPEAGLDSALGPLTAFRCFEFGMTCDGDDDPRGFGHRSNCQPRADSPHVQAVAPFVALVREQKPSSRDVIVAAIVGDVPADRGVDVVPEFNQPSWPMVADSCGSSSGSARPGLRLRLHDFVAGFPLGSARSICESPLFAPMQLLAGQIADAIGDPCVPAPLADVDPALPGVQARCEVTSYIDIGGDRRDPVSVPPCTGANQPCWRVEVDAARCPTSPNQLAFTFDRSGAALRPGELNEVRCQLER